MKGSRYWEIEEKRKCRVCGKGEKKNYRVCERGEKTCVLNTVFKPR